MSQIFLRTERAKAAACSSLRASLIRLVDPDQPIEVVKAEVAKINEMNYEQLVDSAVNALRNQS